MPGWGVTGWMSAEVEVGVDSSGQEGGCPGTAFRGQLWDLPATPRQVSCPTGPSSTSLFVLAFLSPGSLHCSADGAGTQLLTAVLDPPQGPAQAALWGRGPQPGSAALGGARECGCLWTFWRKHPRPAHAQVLQGPAGGRWRGMTDSAWKLLVGGPRGAPRHPDVSAEAAG